MTQRQWKRLEILRRLERGEATPKAAAQMLGLSVRQVRRLRRRFEAEGAKAVVHASAGRAASNRIDDVTRRRIEKLGRGKYAGFSDAHMHEHLVSSEAVTCSERSVRRVLRAAGLASPRKRRTTRHRIRRERRSAAGMMLLWDASKHAWLEERGPMLSLIGAIDDATGALMPGARFYEQECGLGYLRVLYETVRTHGVPQCIYMDQHGIFRRNDAHWTVTEELRGEQDPTQIGRALKELGIEAIYANSPQAKGRVERMWSTLQDRLTSELRLRKARTLEHANRVLAELYPTLMARFEIAPRQAQHAFATLHRSVELERVCSFRYVAKVRNDNTVRIAGRIFDIPPGPGGRGYAGKKVEVSAQLDGRCRIYLGDVCLLDVPDQGGPLGRRRRMSHKLPSWTDFADLISTVAKAV